jgi:hypothetical protein
MTSGASPTISAAYLRALAASAAPQRMSICTLRPEARSRVSYFMNKFRKLGLIDYNGQMEIHPSLLNVVLHEEPHINS